MHVAIDGRELGGRPTGVGRYLMQLLQEWARLPRAQQHRFTLYTHQALSAVLALDVTVQVLPGSGGTFWEQTRLPIALRRSAPDVLFAPGYSAPLLSHPPTVVSVHDVSFAAHPEWFRPRERLRRRLVTGASARRARLVLTLSEFSRGEISSRLNVPADRIRVIPLGLGLVSDVPSSRADASILHPMILYVGSVFNRRHLPAAIRALPLVRSRVPGARLVVVGENRTWPYEDLAAVADDAGVRDAVDLAEFVDDERLRQLYAAASVFVFLSEYEGLGLTPLEALAYGVPPVVLDTPVAREAYGSAARFVRSPEPASVAEHVLALLTDDGARRAVLARAPGVLARYRWSDAAEATLSALEEAGG